MNILKPELVWIKSGTGLPDRCYRKLPIRNCLRNPEEDDDFSVDVKKEDIEDCDIYDDVDIKCDSNSFWTSIYVSPELMGHVIGKEKAILRRTEDQTKTKIKVPHQKENNGTITIMGKSKNGVGEAYRKIQFIADRARWRTNFTHFISFPMNSKEIKSSFLRFKQDILEKFNLVRGIHESIFQNPDKLHLTVTTLVILDQNERDKAALIFQNCKEEIMDVLQNKPLKVLVKGIEYMNDDPAEVDVLYAKVRHIEVEDDSIQIISNKLETAFVKAGLSKKQYDKVKLHITLMNSLFREEKTTVGLALSTQDRDTFDANPILKTYEDYEFGELEVTEIHISVRHQYKKDGYYFPTSILKLRS